MNSSLTHRSPRALLLAAGLGLVALLAATAPSAEAAFTSAKCEGTSTFGRGASFARDAHGVWLLNFRTNFCSDKATPPNVTYAADGSGAGRRSVGERTSGTGDNNLDGSRSRNQQWRFGMTDEPPVPTGQAQMEQGTDASGDEGNIQVLPLAVGAVAPVVNFPDNCDVKSLDDASETAPAANDTAGNNSSGAPNPRNFTDRVRFTKTEFERIFNGDEPDDQWGEIFPELKAIPGNAAGKTDAQCLAQRIVRVVRFDDSGTSFAFKDFLDTINPTRGWKTTYTSNPDTRNWPNADATSTAGECLTAGPVGTAARGGTLSLTTGCINGNQGVVNRVGGRDGSVGYSDISTARGAGFDITPTTSAGSRDDDRYWTQLPNGSTANNDDATKFEEPTSDPNGFTNVGAGRRGSNCDQTTFRNGGQPLPDTYGNWQNVSGVNSPADFPICSLTYLLAFEDNATAYGTAPTEESQARTVKDYLDSIVSPSGQGILATADYSPVPRQILDIAKAGINTIGFNKAGDAGGGTPTPTPTPTPADGDGDGVPDASDTCATVAGPADNGGCPRAPAPADGDGDGTPDASDRCPTVSGAASNGGCPIVTPPPITSKFSFAGKPVLTGARVRVRVRVNGPGVIRGSSAGTATGTQSKKSTRAGQRVTLLLKLSPGAKRELQRKRKLTVRVRVTFTRTGGKAVTKNTRVVLRKGRR